MEGVRGEVEGESEGGDEEDKSEVGQNADGDVGRERRRRIVQLLSSKVSWSGRLEREGCLP